MLNIEVKCPAPLLKFINLVNLLPKKLPPKFDLTMADANGFVTNRSLAKMFEKDVIDFLLEADKNPVERYSDLFKAQNLFEHFAKINKRNTTPTRKETWEKIKGNPSAQWTVLAQFLQNDYKEREVRGFYGIDLETGVVKPCFTEFDEIFNNFNIPIYRIRSCDVCERFFWANRVDAVACSKKQCSDVLSQRRYQEKKREINAQRKVNRKNVKRGAVKIKKRK